MNTAAIYHRPESEFAYLYKKGKIHLRIRTARSDVKRVELIQGDPYLFTSEQWYLERMPMKKGVSTGLFDYWEIETDASYNRLQYGFYLEGNDGTEVFYCDQGVYPHTEEIIKMGNFYFKMPYFHEVDRFKTPEWVKETVWYQIFPERFANGDSSNDRKEVLPWGSKAPDRSDFFGGDLQGVIDHLDYLVELGINGIYFCPIFKATSNHKYDTIDYFEIDPDFGDKKLFKKLVEEAHKRGIRIMLDAVFNHIGDDSPQWQDVLKDEEKSKYLDWFHIHSFPISYEMSDIPETARDLTYDTFAFTPHMPKLNTANKEVSDYLISIAKYWIEEFDIDAWRLDVANEVDHQFWKRFHKEVTAVKEDIYILGEIWHSSQAWLQGDEFHAVMNYAFTDMIKEYFVKRKLSVSKMVDGLNAQTMLYQQQVNEVMFNVLDSHDTARLLTICNDNHDLARATLAFTFLQQGSPCIYYGTEIGMTGADDPDCRKCMIWETEQQNQAMLTFTQRLIQLRKDYQPVISYGDIQWEIVDDTHDFIGFSKTYQGIKLTAYFNESLEEQQIAITGQPVMSQNAVFIDSELATLSEHGLIVLVEKNKK
ncbi:glycoside hydrolase family 13 protein [Enterococcus sp. LJL99]